MLKMANIPLQKIMLHINVELLYPVTYDVEAAWRL